MILYLGVHKMIYHLKTLTNYDKFPPIPTIKVFTYKKYTVNLVYLQNTTNLIFMKGTHKFTKGY